MDHCLWNIKDGIRMEFLTENVMLYVHKNHKEYAKLNSGFVSSAVLILNFTKMTYSLDKSHSKC